MWQRKKIILAFISIFALGVITGVAVATPLMGRMIGNPYSDEVIARRVFNANFLEMPEIGKQNEKAANDLIAKYVAQYKIMKDKFTDQRFNLYAAFSSELKNILNENEYEKFVADSEEYGRERSKYHKEKENEWKKTREKSKYYNKDYEEAARNLYESRIPTDTKVSPVLPAINSDSYYGDSDNVYDKYREDKKRNGWTTFNESQILNEKNNGE